MLLSPVQFGYSEQQWDLSPDDTPHLMADANQPISASVIQYAQDKGAFVWQACQVTPRQPDLMSNQTSMIYIQESSLKDQLKVLELISATSSFTLILWNYPEASKQGVPLIGGKLINKGFEAVTEYSDNTVPMHSRPLAAKPSLLSYLSRFKRELERSVDSICLYPEKSKHWSACSIGHEGMCLVRDDSFLEPLLAADFKASTEAPDWW